MFCVLCLFVVCACVRACVRACVWMQPARERFQRQQQNAACETTPFRNAKMQTMRKGVFSRLAACAALHRVEPAYCTRCILRPLQPVAPSSQAAAKAPYCTSSRLVAPLLHLSTLLHLIASRRSLLHLSALLHLKAPYCASSLPLRAAVKGAPQYPYCASLLRPVAGSVFIAPHRRYSPYCASLLRPIACTALIAPPYCALSQAQHLMRARSFPAALLHPGRLIAP